MKEETTVKLTALRNAIVALLGANASAPSEDRRSQERSFTLNDERVDLTLNQYSTSQGRATLQLGYGEKEWVGLNLDKDTAETMVAKIRTKFIPAIEAKVAKEKYQEKARKETAERREWAIGEFKKAIVAAGGVGLADSHNDEQSGHIGQVRYSLGSSGYYDIKPWASFPVAPADVLDAVAAMNAVIAKYRIK